MSRRAGLREYAGQTAQRVAYYPVVESHEIHRGLPLARQKTGDD